MPQYDAANKNKRLGSSKGGDSHCGIRGQQGVATRFSASKNVKAIEAAVKAGMAVGQTCVLKRVLATGYTANESGKTAAADEDIALLDLPVMQKYWVRRLRESDSPFVDRLRPRPRTGKVHVGK